MENIGKKKKMKRGNEESINKIKDKAERLQSNYNKLGKPFPLTPLCSYA